MDMDTAGEEKRSLVLPSRRGWISGGYSPKRPLAVDHGAKSIAASTSEWLVMIKSGPPSIVYRML